MGKIKIAENELRKLITKNVKNILREINEMPVADQKYTLADLLNKIGFQGNASSLISRAGNTENTPQNWAKIIRGAATNANEKMVYNQIAQQIETSTTNHQSVAQGIKDPRNDVNNIAVGQTGRYDISGNLYSQIMQIAGGLAQNAGETYNVRTFLQAAQNQGALKGQTEESIKKAIYNKMNSAGVTLSKTNPSAYAKYKKVLDGWMQYYTPYRMREVRDALAIFGQVLNTSRNEMPVTAGFQKALNYFNIMDTKGRPFKADGIIGEQTSTALANAGFNDIYDWKETIKNFQRANGLKDDGIVGDNTLSAFKNAGITRINQLANYKAGREQLANVNQNTAANVSNALNTAGSQPIQLSTPQPTAPGITARPGMMAEGKVRINESELKRLVKESVECALNEMYSVNLQKMGTPGVSSPTFNYESEVENFLKKVGYSAQQIRNGFANGAITVSNTSNDARRQRNFAKNVYSKANYAKNGYKNTQGAATYQINQFIQQTGLETISPGITNLINNRYGNVSNWKPLDFNGWKQWFTLKGKEFLNGRTYKQVVDYLYKKTEQ